MSITDLIQRTLAGDQAAFGMLFDQYKNLVYKTAYLLLDDPYEAEDALQEIFLKVYRALASYQPSKGAFTTWLHRVTVNHCLNRKRKSNPVVSSLEIVDGASPKSSTMEDRLAEEQVLQAALNRLSRKLRAVVVLRYFHELSYAEIAQILEIPLGTVQSRLHLALKQIQNEVGISQPQSIPDHEVAK